MLFTGKSNKKKKGLKKKVISYINKKGEELQFDSSQEKLIYQLFENNELNKFNKDDEKINYNDYIIIDQNPHFIVLDDFFIKCQENEDEFYKRVDEMIKENKKRLKEGKKESNKKLKNELLDGKKVAKRIYSSDFVIENKYNKDIIIIEVKSAFTKGETDYGLRRTLFLNKFSSIKSFNTLKDLKSNSNFYKKDFLYEDYKKTCGFEVDSKKGDMVVKKTLFEKGYFKFIEIIVHNKEKIEFKKYY